MAKRKTSNKEEKPVVTEKPKATRSKTIDWDSMPDYVTIIGIQSKHLMEGKEYANIAKHTAKILVEKGAAKLK